MVIISKKKKQERRYQFGYVSLFFKKMNVLTKSWECKVCKQLFTGEHDLRRHKENKCEEVKTTITCQRKKLKRMVNKSDKAFYGGAMWSRWRATVKCEKWKV